MQTRPLAFFQTTFSEGIKCFQEGKIDSKNTKAHLSLSQSCEVTNKLDKAIKSYQTSLNINFNQPEVFCNLAVIYKSLGKIKEAINRLGKAVKLNKNFAGAQLILAELFIQQNQKDKAKEHYQAKIEKQNYSCLIYHI